MAMQESSTIVALASAPGPAGVALVRISGPESVAIASRLFISRSFGDIAAPPSHQACFGQVKDPESGDILDSALITLMYAPHSYTGEDVAEISCHGSPAVTREIISLCCRLGARLARPGEFTRRALENGRLDLAQAEAVLDLINAQSASAARAAAGKLSGRLSRKVSAVSHAIAGILSRVEASLDFPEDAPEPSPESLAREICEEGRAPVDSLAALYEGGELLRRGTYTAITGRPNAGKSSLLNALLKRERALVSEISGTTRDVLEESAVICGRMLVLADTAGLSPNPDRLEALGMERSRLSLEKAGLVLFVVDSCDFSGDETRLLDAEAGEKPVLVLANKADIASPGELERVECAFPGRPVLRISALTGRNLDSLRDKLVQMLPQPLENPESPNTRQHEALKQAGRMLSSAAENASASSWELVAEDLRSALESLAEISGKNLSSDVLDRIFAQFCIGK